MKIDGECPIELIGSCRNKVQVYRSVRIPQLHTSLHFHLKPIQDKRDSRPGDSDGISKSPDCVDVSTDTLPIVTNQTKEVVTKSSIRHSKCSPDDLRSSGASPKGDDATLYKDEYVSQGEDFVDFNQLSESNQYNNPEGSVLRRSSRQHKMPARFDNYELDKKIVGVILMGQVRSWVRVSRNIAWSYYLSMLVTRPDIDCQSHPKLAFHVLRHPKSSPGTVDGIFFRDHESWRTKVDDI
nr:hypothetical protein Ccrd_024108 [Tanacetum cinerariifolium]